MADNLSPEDRRRCMSRVRTKDTDLERTVRSLAHARGLRFRKHVPDLAGRPDMVFARVKVAVFLDGDFWHGYRFPRWRDTVSPFWQRKISVNRARDTKTFRKLRRAGWRVLRLWQHDIERAPHLCVDRIERLVKGTAESTRRPAACTLQRAG